MMSCVCHKTNAHWSANKKWDISGGICFEIKGIYSGCLVFRSKFWCSMKLILLIPGQFVMS